MITTMKTFELKLWTFSLQDQWSRQGYQVHPYLQKQKIQRILLLRGKKQCPQNLIQSDHAVLYGPRQSQMPLIQMFPTKVCWWLTLQSPQTIHPQAKHCIGKKKCKDAGNRNIYFIKMNIQYLCGSMPLAEKVRIARAIMAEAIWWMCRDG